MAKNYKFRLNNIFFKIIKNMLRSRGYDITHKENKNIINTAYPPDYSKKNIALIGTGASGMQVAPELAKTVKNLFFTGVRLYVH